MYNIIMAVVLILSLCLSRNYLLSFSIFVFTGTLILAKMNFLTAIASVFSEYLYPQALDITKASILTFITFYCGYVGLMEYGGPIKGFTRNISKYSKNKINVQIMAWLSSVIVFFSDLGSPGIIGVIFREEFNKYKLSREKLALIINFTAVPVCSMIPLVGWGLFAIGVTYGATTVLDMNLQPIMLFIKSIPYFSVSLLAIITPLLLISEKFHLPKLHDVEKEAMINSNEYIKVRKKFEAEIAIAQEETKGWILVVTVIVMLFTLVVFMQKDGVNIFNVSLKQFMVYIGISFVLAGLLAMTSMWLVKHKSFMDAFSQYYKMFTRVLSVTAILTMSWMFFQISYNMGIYQSISFFIQAYIPGFLIAPLIFITGCMLSTLTGSAWGTYAVMIPLVLTIGKHMDINLFMTIGASVSGGVYGDINAKNSHVAIYSAESAGVNPQEFLNLQNSYMYAIGLTCIIAFIADYFINNIIAHFSILFISYMIVLLILKEIMNKHEK